MAKKNVIGPRVRQARRRARPPITQVDLAARLQVADLSMGQSVVSKIEQGQRAVFDYEVVALAKALGVSADWLLGEKENSRDTTTS